MRAAKSLILVMSLASFATAGGCVDSEVTGNFDNPADGDVIKDTSGDIADDADSTPIDVPDGIDAGCTTNAQCVSVLGTLRPCDVALCDATRGVCFAGRKSDCCETVSDCVGSADPCVAVSCPVPGQACEQLDTCPPCQLDNDCQAIAPACTQGRCDERGACRFDRLENCCVSPTDCDDGDLCTTKRCTAGVCGYNDNGAAGCCTAPKVINTNFTSPPEFRATTTSNTVRWSGIDFDLAPSPPIAFYLGNPSAYNIVSAVPVRAEATFRLGPVVAGETLEAKFQIYLDAGPNPPLSVLLRYFDGQQVVVWSAAGAAIRSWFPVKSNVTIPRTGQAQLVLSYQAATPTTDGSLLGVLLDDLQVRTACGHSGCVSDLQCVSDDPCVLGRCTSSGTCGYQDVPGCCRSAADCPVPPGCFNPTCEDNRCGVAARPNCCLTDDECGPSPDPCNVASRCIQRQCTLVPRVLPCDDGNPCTADSCIGNACLHELIPGCCVGPDCDCHPDVASWDFQQSNQGWSFDSPVAGYGWYRVQIQGAGGSRTLYFGNPDAGPAVDPGFPMTATAAAPFVNLPANAQSITVSFQGYVAIDGGQPTDQIRLVAVGSAGQTIVLWQLSAQTPRYTLINPSSQALSGLAGQAVQLRFVYQATDSSRASGFGFLADDVAITAVCGGGQCTTPATCPSGPACTLRTCQSGVCGFAPLNCDDANVCTDDFCDPDIGTCLNLPNGAPGCVPQCQNDGQCQDGLVCTNDFCDNGQCIHKPEPGCCQTDGDCNDGNVCTVDQCFTDFGVCINQLIPGCGGCESAAQCDDGDPCTADFCSSTGQCQHAADPTLPGCGCQGDDQCADDDPCTFDVCTPDGQCAHIPDPGAPGCGPECQNNFQCADGDPCTQDRCTPQGVCTHQPNPNIPGCVTECQNNFQCNDGDVCTQDRCTPQGTCTHQLDPNIPGCLTECHNDFQCISGDPCTLDRCGPDGVCVHLFDPTLPGCGPECQTNAQCDDGDVCTQDACTLQGTCEHQFVPAIPGCGGCLGPQDCNDGRACTQDLCSAAGDCLNFPIPGCCESNGQCQDGDPCTDDRCDLATGACSHVPISSDACGGCDLTLCDDNNACTSDTCNSFTGACDHSPIPGCCTANPQCGDGDSCTFDQCDNGVCTHTFLPLPGCQPDCQVDADCADGNPCTTNRCGANGTCRINIVFGCCDNDSECGDNNACTSDTCYGQIGVCFNQQIGCNDNNACTTDSCDPQVGCVFAPIPGCCSSAAQCNDGNPCTSDGCAGGTCVHSPSDSCCASDADCVQPLCAQGTCLPDGQCIYDGCCETGPDGRLCDDGDPCTDDVCGADGGCRHTAAAGCCVNDADCPADVDCTDWRCDPNQHQCVSQTDPSCCQEATVKSYAFPTGGLAGWTVEPAQTQTAVTWWISNRRSTSPPSALYMGNPAAGNYNNGGIPKAYATTPSIALPTAPGIEMTFRVWLDIEQFQNFDPFFIDVLAGGSQPTTVWDKTAIPGGSYRSWVAAKLNLTPWAGQTIRLRFRFEADDNLLNDTEGIFVDDMVIRSLCEPVSLCNSDFECNDGDACTNDRCVASVCQAQPIPGCCVTTADCDDAYACTTDACVAGKCQNALLDNCCVADGECDDGRACTSDACDQASHSCVFIDTGGCCQTAGDCSDGDSCTSDICQPNGTCRHGANLSDPTCCEAGNFFTEHFSLSALTTFTVQGDGSQVRWRAYNGQVFTPPFALYYGNPATHDFDSGTRTFGTATSAEIAIPTGAHNARLTFNVWLDVDNFPFDDLLSARIIVGGNAFTVWERTDLGFGTSQQWIPVTIDLPAQVAGRTIRVQFAFDSVDEQDNDGEGVYVDDVSVFAICP